MRMDEPAFPCNVQDSTTLNGFHHKQGMTLRDYFAAKFAQTLLADVYCKRSGVIGTNSVEYVIAEEAYKVADAMLKESGV